MATVSSACQHFFSKRLTKEHMPSLTERNKWREKRRNLKEGGVVLVAEPNQQRGMWPSGRIVSTPAWIRWDRLSSHGAYSVRGV